MNPEKDFYNKMPFVVRYKCCKCGNIEDNDAMVVIDDSYFCVNCSKEVKENLNKNRLQKIED